MGEKVKVLHITEKLQSGGIENFIMNVYRKIDREKVHFDFLVTRDEAEFFDEEIKLLGGKKFIINKNKNQSVLKRVLQEAKDLEKFLKENPYDIVHVHSGTPLRMFYLKAAKKAGIPVRVYHSHSAKVKGPHKLLALKTMFFSIMKQFFPRYTTHFFACSKAAGEWMYPKKIQERVEVIHNGIDTKKFQYNEEKRKEYRKKLEMENHFVIGHVGRFNDQKNHTFLIDIFYDLLKVEPEAILLLIGSGELEENIKEKVQRLGIENQVKMLGVRDDIPCCMQAMDVFVLPSNYEGLPVVGIEAQAAGLPCVFSDQITEEVKITNNVEFLPIQETKPWVEQIQKEKKFERKDTIEEIKNHHYAIEQTAQKLQEFYEKKGKEER